MLAKLRGMGPSKCRCIPAVIALLAVWNLCLPGPAGPRNCRPSEQEGAAEFWYVVNIAGQPAGYVRETIRTREHAVHIDSEMRIVLNRLGSRIEIGFRSSSEESPDGLLRRAGYEMTASNQTMRTESVVGERKIEVKNESGGKTYTSALEYSGDIYGSEGIRRMTVAALKNPGDTITVQTYVAEASLVGRLTRTVLSRESIRIGDRDIAALKMEEILEGMPVKRTGFLDEQGYLLKQEEPGPFGVIEIVRSGMSDAMAAALGGGELPAEIFQRSIIRSNIRLPRAGPIDRLKIRLTHRNPELGWPDVQISGQRVLQKSEKDLVVEIRRTPPPSGAAFPVEMTETNRPYLQPNAYVQSDDPRVQGLSKELAGTEKNAFPAALAMERWVAENMTFDLGIAFAPATEIIRDKRGTCVGYATLLASLTRAAGIPSRIILGYVYALGMFGGHAWTEILIGEEWVPLDAAVVNEGAADATRLAVVASSLAEGPGSLTIGAAQQVFGQVGMEVLEFETAGRKVVVPAGAEAFSEEGDVYENEWLGIRLTKPAEFRFGRLDAVWPDPTVVALEGTSQETAVLEQHQMYPWEVPQEAAVQRLAKLLPSGKKGKVNMDGGEALVLEAPDRRESAAAIVRGLEIWILRVEANDAPAILRKLLGSLRIFPLSD
ncbi:MAG: transglutaminase domain-containing protein [Candidatus Aminicenantes bacterium]|nr:transglutaminase domain-containing protein [Candidatus Aminicenantes bacterium]